MLLIACLIGLRLLVAATMVLVPEEAYYWMYSRYPAWGYLDHPPMVAWLISLGTSVFGQTELGVRIGTWAVGVASTWLCFVLASEWYGRRAGLSAAVLFLITPMFFCTGFLAMPDAPLIFFWLVTLVAVTKAYRKDAPLWWIVAGGAVGLGFISKYPAVFLFLSTFLFLLSDNRGRRMLCRPAPWVGLLVGAVFASPVIFWNATNDWASFQFQFARRLGHEAGFVPLHTPKWVGAQFALLSPLVFMLLAVTLWAAIRRFRKDTAGSYRFAVCFAVPWLFMCAWHGLSTSVKVNWPLPAYLSLIPTAVVVLRVRNLPIVRRKRSPERQRYVRRYVATVAAVLFAASVVVVGRFPHIPLPAPIAPWNDLGTNVEIVEEAHEQATGKHPFIMAAGKYRIASELGFYMRELGDAGSDDWQDVIPISVPLGGGLAFAGWRNMDDFVGRDAVYISETPTPEVKEFLAGLFHGIGEARPFFSYSDVLQSSTFWVIPCHSLRAMPSN